METSDLLIFYFRDISFSPYIPSICTQEGNSLKSTTLFFFYQISNFLTKLAGVEKNYGITHFPDLLSLHQSSICLHQKVILRTFCCNISAYSAICIFFLLHFIIKAYLEYTIELSLLFFVYDFKCYI